MKCANCGRELSRNETGLSFKLINRNTRECFCLECLSKRFRTSPEHLLELAEHFRKAGCTLFT